MSPQDLVILIENHGIALLALAGLGIVLAWLALGVRKAVSDFYALGVKFMTNHMVHFQRSLDELVTNSTEANKKLDVQTQMLGLHGAKLDQIVEQTKKPPASPL